MSFLFRLGVHSPEWRPGQHVDGTTWLQIRRCHRCRRYLSQRPSHR